MFDPTSSNNSAAVDAHTPDIIIVLFVFYTVASFVTKILVRSIESLKRIIFLT